MRRALLVLVALAAPTLVLAHVPKPGADHIYSMDVAAMLREHVASGAKATLAAIPVPRKDGKEFGIAHVDEKGRVVEFLEKPDQAPEIPGRPGFALASMGNYVFDRAW